MSRFAAMRKGDRAALRALLDENGASYAAAAKALGSDAVIEMALALWQESAVLWDAPSDERAHALSVALAAAIVPVLEAMPRLEVDARIAAAQLARGETALCDVEPRLRDVDVKGALAAARSAAGAGPYPALWARIEPLLK